jgi:hypothetical protein
MTPLDDILAEKPQVKKAPQKDGDYDDKLGTLVAWFEDSEEATEDARKKSERDRDYYDGKQFTAAELKILKDRGQPDIVINRIQPKINYLMGYEATNRTDPRAYPRTPQDTEAAEACTDALRYVKDATDLDQTFSNVWENLMIEGYGGLELTVEEKPSGEVEISPIRWDWDRLFYDPHSRRHDFSDARYLGGVMWMDAEEAKQRWPDYADQIERTLADFSSNSRTFDDRPDRWVSRTGQGHTKRHRIRICQIYYKEGGAWHHCTFTRGVKLDSMEVPFRDQDGQSWCPLLMQSAYVDRDNNRYGLVRLMIGVQDEINKRRAKALHRLTMRQVVAETGAVVDVDAAKQELAKPDGFVEVSPGFRFEMLNGAEQLMGELNLLQEAKNEIESMGPNAALLGKDADAPSGKAILANQQGGQTEIALLLDRQRHLKRQTYRRIWDLIRQYKKEEWWVRVTDDEKNVKFVGFNRPITAKEAMTKRLRELPEEQQQQAMLQIEQEAQDPIMAQQLEQVIGRENVAADMFMDITIEEVPDVANVQAEQFAQLTSLAPAVVFPPEIYIEASSLRNKKDLIEKLKGDAPDPVAVEMAKIQAEQAMKKTEAEIEKLRAEALKARVEADKADAELGMVLDPQVITAGAPAAPAQPELAPEMAGPVDELPPPGMTGDVNPMPPPG